jgi:hypothetical protein
MSVRITFDVFSGRPNPSATLTEAEAADLLKRIGPASVTTAAPGSHPEPSMLGYRGLVVEQFGTPANGLPQRFRLSSNAVASATSSLKSVDASVERSILGNASILARAGASAELATMMRAHAAVARTTIAAPAPATTPGPLVCRCAPLYEPNWWNDGASGGAKQFWNNCYNYACDYRTDTFAQPGNASGDIWHQLVCANVSAAAVRDSLIPTKEAMIKCPAEGHLVALCMWNTFDYHWYRMGRDGFWSHKPGGMPVTNLDNSGQPIRDPRTANRGDYTSFCGFMIVMHGHVKIK